MATRGHLRAFRFVVEGLGVEWVTDRAMERTRADGRKLIRGLRIADGVTVEAKVDPARAEIEASPMSIEVVEDRALQATSWLYRQPSVISYLAADVAASGAVTITLSSSSGISAGDVIHIDTEALLVATVPTGTTITVVAGGRGYWDTTAQAHYTSDGADLRSPAVYVSRVSSVEGRRAEVYAYGRGDALTGDGSLIFRGTVSTDSRLGEGGGVWSMTLDPLWSLAKQDLGADLSAPMLVRGIRYQSGGALGGPFERLRLIVTRGGTTIGSGRDSTTPANVDLSSQSFADNDAWVEWLNTQVSATVEAWTGIDKFHAVSDGDAGWHFAFKTAAASPHYPIIAFDSPIEQRYWDGPELYTLASDGTLAGTVIASTWYEIHGYGPGGSVPRGWSRGLTNIIDVGGDASLSGIESVTIDWGDGETDEDVTIDSVSTANRTITLRATSPRHTDDAFRPRHIWLGGSVPTVKVRRTYGYGTIGDLMSQITTLAPSEANRGAVPFITTADADVATWQSEADAASALRPLAAHRRFIAAKETKLDELLREHMKLTGLMPTIDSAGRMSVRQLRMPLSTELGLTTIDTSDIIGTPSMERSAVGSINQVILETGYEPSEDKFTGTTYRVRDVRAFGARKSPRTLKIKPKSIAAAATIDQVVELAEPVLGVFAHPYAIVTAELIWPTVDGLSIGDGVLLTHPVLPDVLTGSRGVTAMPGIVIGKALDLAAAKGTVTILASYLDGAGYTPDVYVSANAVVAGAQYDLTVTFDDPYAVASMAPTGAVLSDYYAVGDTIERIEWDAATQTPLSATIDAVTDGTMTLRVTFTAGAPASWADTYTMRYPVAGSASTAQQAYAYMAPSTALIGFSTARNARVWGS